MKKISVRIDPWRASLEVPHKCLSCCIVTIWQCKETQKEVDVSLARQKKPLEDHCYRRGRRTRTRKSNSCKACCDCHDVAVAEARLDRMDQRWSRYKPVFGHLACRLSWTSCICVPVVICMILCVGGSESSKPRESRRPDEHRFCASGRRMREVVVSSQIVSHHRAV